MDITVKTKTENKLLNRTEIEGTLSYNGPTPSNATITKELATHFKTEENLVLIKHIYTIFGQTKAEIQAYLYKDRPTLEKVEFIKKKPKKKAEAAAEAPAKKK